MKRSLPPLTWFRSFEAAARTLSSTAAAAEIGMTQSAVSQQIRALEGRLGVALFRRHARGLTLTDEGRKLLPKVEGALETLQAATQIYHPTGNDEQLSIAASISVIDWLIAPALPEFQKAHPNVKIRFLGTIWPDEFSVPKADVEIRFGSLKQVGKGAVALEPNRLIALKSPVLEGSIEQLRLIETVGTSNGWEKWRAVAVQAGEALPDLKPSLFCDSYGLSLRLAATGSGVSLTSSVIAGHALTSGALQLAHKQTMFANEGYYLALRRPTSVAQAFYDWILELVANSHHILERTGYEL